MIPGRVNGEAGLILFRSRATSHAPDTTRARQAGPPQAGVLAQKRLARGLRLNYPEAVALIATQLLEFIRDGRSVAELMDLGRQLPGHADVMDGVAEMIDEVQVEGTFPDGTKLVTVHHPIVAEHGDLALALYGSFLPRARAPPARSDAAGCARCAGWRHARPRTARSCSTTGARRVRAGGDQPWRSSDPGRQPLSLHRDQPRARLRPRRRLRHAPRHSRRHRRALRAGRHARRSSSWRLPAHASFAAATRSARRAGLGRTARGGPRRCSRNAASATVVTTSTTRSTR